MTVSIAPGLRRSGRVGFSFGPLISTVFGKAFRYIPVLPALRISPRIPTVLIVFPLAPQCRTADRR